MMALRNSSRSFQSPSLFLLGRGMLQRQIETAAAVKRITLPQRMIQRLEREKEKMAGKQRQQRQQLRGPVLISCKRSKFNHRKGQAYSNFTPQVLASQGWKHRKAKGDYFTINSCRGNPALQMADPSVQSFTDLGLNDKLVEGLNAMQIRKPTNIQALAIPHMMAMKNVLIAAETGSGKTLAYLLPVLHHFLEYRAEVEHKGLNNPFCIILTPSHELVNQLQDVARHLAQYVPFHVHSAVGGQGTQRLLKDPQVHPVDIMVATPGVLSKLFTNRIYQAKRLHHLILDEADTLLDDSFSPLTLRLLNKFKIQHEKENTGDQVLSLGTQVALVGATLPRSLQDLLSDVVPVSSIEKVVTNSLHRLMPHVPQKFLRLGSSDKPEKLLQLLESNTKRSIPTIVFCNKSTTCSFLSHFLRENNLPFINLSGSMPTAVRRGKFEQFQDGEVDVLVCTDIASRGLDTVRAQHVINYDFPDFMSDYIHRVGRVGRVGSNGTSFVVSFITHKWDVDLLWRIEAAARQVTELHNVNANIKRKLKAIHDGKLGSQEEPPPPPPDIDTLQRLASSQDV